MKPANSLWRDSQGEFADVGIFDIDKTGKQIVKTTQSVKNQTTGSKPTTSKPTSDNRLLRGFIGGSSF